MVVCRGEGGLCAVFLCVVCGGVFVLGLHVACAGGQWLCLVWGGWIVLGPVFGD